MISLKGGKNTGYSIVNDFGNKIDFYTSGTCGCCSVYEKYLARNGVDVNVVNNQKISEIKEKYGVPLDLESCHTFIIGDYFIEGHMPLEAIDKLLKEKPNIAGIALAGMPNGAPGMTGTKDEDFVIYSVNKDGTYQEFMRI